MHNLSYYAKQDKTNYIYGEICKHMNEPGRIYIFAALIKKIEEQASDKKTDNDNRKHPEREPSGHNRHMICRKRERAEYVCEFSRCLLLQHKKRKAPEEKFL